MLANQENVKNKYAKYKTTKQKSNYDSLCDNKGFELSNAQKFLGEYIKKQKKLLLYHGIGSGKTITIIHICESSGLAGNMYIITQASLIRSFYEEIIKYDIAMKKFKYVDKEIYAELKDLERNKIIRILTRAEKIQYNKLKLKIIEKIKKKYYIYSYERFAQRRLFDLHDQQLLIIDEVQNVLNLESKIYLRIREDLIKSKRFTHGKSCGIILSSATPVYDNYKDFFATINILSFDDPFDYKVFTSPNKPEKEKIEYLKKLIKYINEHVSYYAPANSENILYPKKFFQLVKCEMSDYQYNRYIETGLDHVYDSNAASLSPFFYSGPRMVANFAFPGDFDERKKHIKSIYFEPYNLKKYSAKYYTLIKNLKDSTGKVVIYSNFTNNFGINLIKQLLDYYGYVDYAEISKNDEIFKKYHKKYKTFACFTGSETDKYRNEIKDYYNYKDNKDGKNLKILLISPAGKEGLTLLGVREIHIMEPYWNKSRIEQIEGRGFRSCSHRYLPPKDRTIKTFLYIATIKQHIKKSKQDKIIEEYKKKNGKSNVKNTAMKDTKMMNFIKYFKSVDEYIYEMAEEKEIVSSEFKNLLKLNSIDCELFKTANGIEKCKKKNLMLDSLTNYKGNYTFYDEEKSSKRKEKYKKEK